ncbi:MAG: alpha-N-arabinofuranosidase [Opitutales bacterium]|nr:alpha-N-arabinofuranosidase [Opitutales bacterium]
MAAFAAQTQSVADASVVVKADSPGAVVAPEIYGQFAEHLGTGIYGGVWVGENSDIPNTRGMRNDVIEALRNLHLSVVRWPGGCFADEYHWRDGIGPRENRPSMINTNWGGVVEDNSFGTHEFLDFCELVGAEPFISGNIGSGTVQEMSQWVEYMTSDADTPMTRLRKENGRAEPWKIKYFGIGNETWGCGGSMTAEFYSDQFRKYNTFLKNYGGNKLFRIACGPSDSNYEWTRVLMEKVGHAMNALSLHYYTLPTGDWSRKGSAVDFEESEWFSTLRRTLMIDEFIGQHSRIMDRKDPEKKIALAVDEWGTWYDAQPGTNPGFLRQQNTLRDSMVAALNLHIFHAHADRVRMANIAQMVNVLQAMILTEGPEMVLTPTYHVFEMYKVHQGGTFIPVSISTPDYVCGDERIPAVYATATMNAEGTLFLSLVNVDPNKAQSVSCSFEGYTVSGVSGRILTAPAMDSENSFEQPDVVKPVAFDGASVEAGSLRVEMPAKSILVLEIESAAK